MANELPCPHDRHDRQNEPHTFLVTSHASLYVYPIDRFDVAMSLDPDLVAEIRIVTLPVDLQLIGSPKTSLRSDILFVASVRPVWLVPKPLTKNIIREENDMIHR
jgi:hypothetical protein